MLVWKLFLAISTIGLLVGTAALGAGATFNTLAATHAMIGAVSLFVALLCHTGRINDALDLVLRVTGGYAALLVWRTRSSLDNKGAIEADTLLWFEQESGFLSFQKASE